MTGPAGITYTAPPEEQPVFNPASSPPPVAPPGPAPTSAYAQPSEVASSGASPSSPVAGAVALIGGAVAIVGSLLQWGKGSVTDGDGVEQAIIEVAGFDSSGLVTAIFGGVMVILAALFFMGVPKQLYWAIAAFIAGGAILGTVVYSMFDIQDLSARYAVEWQDNPASRVGDVIMTQADLGLWVTCVGGVLSVLAAPFADRN